MKTTPLHDSQVRMGARMTEFAGWELPLFYSGILDEVRAVRQRAGLFDVSHMGRLVVSGRDALALLQRLTTNDLTGLVVGRGHYNLLCNEQGGIIDDLTIFRRDAATYLLVVNAANTQKDVEWIRSHQVGDVMVADVTDQTALLALQGPKSADVMETATRDGLPVLSRFSCGPISVADADCVLCRAGYTGEVGYEIHLSANTAIQTWEALLIVGPGGGAVPCGLGSRDVLRVEAGYVLYGQDIDENTDPFTAQLSRFVRLDKPDFIGREALLRIAETGSALQLSGIRMEDRAVPRPGAAVVADTRVIGTVTSGAFSPTIARGIALAYIESDINQSGLEVEVILREKPHRGLIVKPPFY